MVVSDRQTIHTHTHTHGQTRAQSSSEINRGAAEGEARENHLDNWDEPFARIVVRARAPIRVYALLVSVEICPGKSAA